MKTNLLAATALTAALAFAGGSALAQTSPTGTASRIPSATSQTAGQSSQASGGMYGGMNGMSGQQSNGSTATGTSLASMQNAKTTLKQAKVEDSAGTRIGMVKSVRTGANGDPLAVDVSLTSNHKTVSIPASDLRYEQSSKTLKAEMTKAQIEKMAKGGGTNPM